LAPILVELIKGRMRSEPAAGEPAAPVGMIAVFHGGPHPDGVDWTTPIMSVAGPRDPRTKVKVVR